jgi:hypothetical protein
MARHGARQGAMRPSQTSPPPWNRITGSSSSPSSRWYGKRVGCTHPSHLPDRACQRRRPRPPPMWSHPLPAEASQHHTVNSCSDPAETRKERAHCVRQPVTLRHVRSRHNGRRTAACRASATSSLLPNPFASTPSIDSSAPRPSSTTRLSSRVPAPPRGQSCHIIEAPWLVNGGHGASLTHAAHTVCDVMNWREA